MTLMQRITTCTLAYCLAVIGVSCVSPHNREARGCDTTISKESAHTIAKQYIQQFRGKAQRGALLISDLVVINDSDKPNSRVLYLRDTYLDSLDVSASICKSDEISFPVHQVHVTHAHCDTIIVSNSVIPIHLREPGPFGEAPAHTIGYFFQHTYCRDGTSHDWRLVAKH